MMITIYIYLFLNYLKKFLYILPEIIDLNFSRSLLTVLTGTQYRRQKLWMTWICRGMTSILLIVQLLSVALSVDQRHRKSQLARPSGYAIPSQLISQTSKFIHTHY